MHALASESSRIVDNGFGLSHETQRAVDGRSVLLSNRALQVSHFPEHWDSSAIYEFLRVTFIKGDLSDRTNPQLVLVVKSQGKSKQVGILFYGDDVSPAVVVHRYAATKDTGKEQVSIGDTGDITAGGMSYPLQTTRFDAGGVEQSIVVQYAPPRTLQRLDVLTDIASRGFTLELSKESLVGRLQNVNVGEKEVARSLLDFAMRLRDSRARYFEGLKNGLTEIGQDPGQHLETMSAAARNLAS